MKKLNLPEPKKPLPPSKSLSMDDYLAFVQMHLKHTFNKSEYLKQKKRSAVNVPFCLR